MGCCGCLPRGCRGCWGGCEGGLWLGIWNAAATDARSVVLEISQLVEGVVIEGTSEATAEAGDGPPKDRIMEETEDRCITLLLAAEGKGGCCWGGFGATEAAEGLTGGWAVGLVGGWKEGCFCCVTGFSIGAWITTSGVRGRSVNKIYLIAENP